MTTATPAGPRDPHLPEGRPIGRGTRERRARLRWELAGSSALTALALGTSIPLAFMSDTASQAAVALGVGVTIAVAALAFGALPAGRMLRPRRRARGIDLEVDRTELRRGERLDVTVRADDPVEVGLVCVRLSERKASHRDAHSGREVASRVATEKLLYEEWHAAASGLGAHTATLTVPAGRAQSQEGKGASIAWRVSGRRAGAGRRAPRTDVPIWVLP